MGLSSWRRRAALLLALVVARVAADSTCSTGYLDGDRKVCCPKSCTRCGGNRCEKLPGLATNCCTSPILKANKSCKYNKPPCVMAAAVATPDGSADPQCSRGKLNYYKDVCCPAGVCGAVCGGTQCAKTSGGSAKCCTSAIKASKRSCNNHAAPCIMGGGGGGGAAPTPAPTPKKGSTSSSNGDPFCLKGILHAFGDQCCPKGCGVCGGNCAANPLGAKNCCANSIKQAGRSCDTNQAPCNLNHNRPPDYANMKRATDVSLLTPTDEELYTKEQSLKVSFDGILVFQQIQRTGWAQVKKHLDKGKKVQVVMEFLDSYSNCKDIAAGKYDKFIAAFGAKAKADGREVWIRPLHEFNGDWYPWGAYRKGNSIDSMKAAFRHIVTKFRATGGNFKFQAAYNLQNAHSDRTPFKDFYPGDAYVDEVCVSTYNFAGIGQAKSAPLASIFGYVYVQIGLFTNKPMCIGEMSTTSYGINKPEWISSAWDSLAMQFTKVETINWFFENKNGNNGYVDWALNTAADKTAFVNGMRKFKSMTKP